MSNPQSQHARCLEVCSQARLTLAGKVKGGGFWIMPAGKPFIMACWQQNMERARRLRTAASENM